MACCCLDCRRDIYRMEDDLCSFRAALYVGKCALAGGPAGFSAVRTGHRLLPRLPLSGWIVGTFLHGRTSSISIAPEPCAAPYRLLRNAVAPAYATSCWISISRLLS